MSASTAKLLRLVDLNWTEERAKNFWAKVTKTDGCWLFTQQSSRYGCFGIGDGKIARVNRLSYALHFGEAPAGQEVCHECDNDKCVRPEHLFLGTRLDNMQDMARKGRAADKQGTLNGRCTVTPEQVMSVVERFSKSGVSQVEIAAELGISTAIVNGILKGRLWAHLTGITRQVSESAEIKEKRQQEILLRYKEVSAEQVALEFGVTAAHVYNLKYVQKKETAA